MLNCNCNAGPDIKQDLRPIWYKVFRDVDSLTGTNRYSCDQ